MAETVIIDVAINQQDANARVAELGKSIKVLKEEQKQLKDANQETNSTYVANASQLRLLAQEQKAYSQIATSAAGSNFELRAQLSLLTQQYNGLSKEERDNTTAGKALQIQIKGISDELKKNESAIGDNRRNVGNYKDALTQSNEATQQASASQKQLLSAVTENTIGFKIGGDAIGGVTAQVKAFRQATEEAKVAQQAYKQAQQISTEATEAATQATAKATQIGFLFSQGQATESQVLAANTAATDANIVATNAQSAATEAQVVATNSATNATKIFKVALASTGIGAIVIIVVALLNYLSKFDPIMDKVEQGFAAVGSVVTRVTDIVVSFFTNLKSLGDFVTKFGDFLEHPIDSMKKFGEEIAETARQAVELKKAQQDLEDSIKIQEIGNAAALQQIKELQVQSKNRSLTEQQRIALSQKADKIETENFKRSKAIADEKLRIAYEDLRVNSNVTNAEIENIKRLGLAEAIRLKDSKRVTDEQIDAIKDAQLEDIRIKDEATQREEKRQNLQDSLREKAAQAEEKRRERLKKAQEDADKAEEERLNSIIRIGEASANARQKDLDALNREIDAKIKEYKRYGATVQQLEAERLQRTQQIEREYRIRNLQDEATQLEQIKELQIQRIVDKEARELAELQLSNQRKLDAQDQLIAETFVRIAEGEQGLTDLLLSQQQLRDEILLTQEFENNERKLAAEQEFLTRQTEFAQRNLEARQQIQDEQNALAVQGLGVLEQVFGKETALGKAAFLAQKAFAIAQIVIDTQRALAANRTAEQVQNATLSAIPFVGNALAIANSVVKQAERQRLLIQGAISGAAVAATAIQGFSTGGEFISDGGGSMVVGSGTGKSDSINARLSNGESVINAKSTQMYKPLLSAINVAGGGRALVPGYAMATGGIAQTTSRSIEAKNDILNIVRETVSAMPAPIVTVEQFNRVQNEVLLADVRASV